MTTPYKCVIVANGRFPQTTETLDCLHKADTIIACDGATEALHQTGLTPDAIVGDLDSISTPLRELYANRIHQVKNQEINDLTKAINFAHEAGHTEVLILGGTGLREDHTLGNISLLMEYAPMFRRVEMMSDYGLFTPLLQSSTFESFPGQQVSLFSMFPEGEISTSGLRWPLQNRKLTAWWQGTLNEALEDNFKITLSADARIIVYRSR